MRLPLHRLLVSTILTVTLLWHPMLAQGQDLPSAGIVATELIYEEAPFPQCHASTIEWTGENLVAAWFGGTREKHPDVGIWFSRHDGKRWSAPVEVANGVQN